MLTSPCAAGVTCICTIAVQSGDDVLVLNKCQENEDPDGFSLIPGELTTQLYLNGELTPGTYIYSLPDETVVSIYVVHNTTKRTVT